MSAKTLVIPSAFTSCSDIARAAVGKAAESGVDR